MSVVPGETEGSIVAGAGAIAANRWWEMKRCGGGGHSWHRRPSC